MAKPDQPNILFIMADDHAAHAISAYGSRINETPHLDRIANEGMRLDNCFCTNSICSPSRATILTGLYSHKNGVRTLSDKFDASQEHVGKMLQRAGYQTAIVGKWHLGHGEGHDPTGFDYWSVVPGQGLYHSPVFIELGRRKRIPGYATDIITDLSLDWLKNRDPDRPFFLMCHHKAPHRPWQPDAKYAHLYEDIDIPEPPTFYDDYQNRSAAAAAAEMRIDRDMTFTDLKEDPPEGLTPLEQKRWNYQRYIKDYLRCVASIDDNVGRLLDYLDEEGIAENTVVIYTSDQGFFLGDHGWYDKRFFYEESLRMPFLIRYPKEIAPASTSDKIVINPDFAPLFLDYAGVSTPDWMQGRSFRPILQGNVPDEWRSSMYYRYYMHGGEHNVYAHYGVRTDRYKLIYYYEEDPGPQEWELFDLEKDPYELRNVVNEPEYAEIVKELKAELHRLRVLYEDHENPWEGEPAFDGPI